MSFIVTASLIAVSTAVNVYGMQEGAKAEQESMKRRAEEEKIAAQARALERQQELGRVLAANNASMAADGQSGEGTPASIALTSAKNIGSSEQTLALSSRLRQAQMRRQGSLARTNANLSSLSSIAGSAVSIARLGGGEKDGET
jgi:hypothetical protein|tara:strand:- start:10 stop:441 length:432 start_codon:yes stop_codon:yes gene_type:complete